MKVENLGYKLMEKIWAMVVVFCTLISCGEEKEQVTQSPPPPAIDTLFYTVSVDKLRMRSEPNLTSETLTLLPEGVLVKYWDEHSHEETTVNLRGQSITAHWFRVTHGKYDGWVFGGALEKVEAENGLDHLMIPGERVGPIYVNDTEQVIIDRIGGEHVIRGDYMIGEGESVQATYVYPSTDQELILLWIEEDFTQLREVRISRQHSPWRTEEGIHVGSTLKEVEKANGSPFLMSGFQWDYAGSTLSWQEGIFTEHIAMVFAEPTRVHKALKGDQSISSSDDRLQRANPTVSLIRALF